MSPYIRFYGTVGVVLLILLSFAIWFTVRWRKRPKIWIPSAVFLTLVLAVNIMFGFFVDLTRPRIGKKEALRVALRTELAQSFVDKYPEVTVSAIGFGKWFGPDTLVYLHARKPVRDRNDLSTDILLTVPVRNAERRPVLDKQELRMQVFKRAEVYSSHYAEVTIKNAFAFLRDGADQAAIQRAIVELETPSQEPKWSRILVEPAGNIHSANPYSKEEVKKALGTMSKAQGRTQPSLRLKVKECLDRLCAAVEKVYEEVGLRAEDVQALFASQAIPQKLMGKWKVLQKAWPAIVRARKVAIEEMASLGPDAVPALLKAKDESIGGTALGDIFVEAIVKIGKPAVPAVIDGLSDADGAIRARAATSLGKIGDRRAVEPLIRALSDSDRRVVSATVWSLGLLGDSRAADPLLNLWNKKEVVDRTGVAWSLGRIGDKRAAEPIIAALKECVLQAQETGNWNMNGWDMRVYAGALGQIGDSRAIPLLKKMLLAGPQRTKAAKPKYLVAEAAAEALRSLGLSVEGDEEKGGYKIVK